MIITTTDNIEGYRIIKYFGIVVGYGEDIETSINDLIKKAKDFGANAIIVVRIENENIGDEEEYIVGYYAYGTAVKIEKKVRV